MSFRSYVILAAGLIFGACASAPDPIEPPDFYESGQYDPALKTKVIIVAQSLFVQNADLCPSVKTVSRAGMSDFEVCNVVTGIYASAVRNAHIEPLSDGSDKIWLSSALVETLEHDELAFLIAHELSHRIAGHNIEAGSSPKLELQADAIAQYLVARAGYDLGAAEALIKRLNIGAGGETQSHPAQADRLAVLAAARIDIEQKRLRGEAIIPPRPN